MGCMKFYCIVYLVFISRTCGDWHLSNTHLLMLKMCWSDLNYILFSSLDMMMILINEMNALLNYDINNQTFPSKTVQNLLIPNH